MHPKSQWAKYNRYLYLAFKVFFVLGMTTLALLVIYRLRAVTTPIFLAFFLAYLIDPLVNKLARYRISRTAAVIMMVLIAVAVLTSIAIFVVPIIFEEIGLLIQRIPSYVERLADLGPWLEKKFAIKINTSVNFEQITQLLQSDGTQLAEPAVVLLQTVLESTWTLVISIISLLLIPMFTVYFLLDFDRIKQTMQRAIPPRYRNEVFTMGHAINQLLSGFIRGTLTICVTLGTLYSIGYSVVGVKLSLLIGVLTGIMYIVPYVGSLIGFFLAMLMALLEGGWEQVVGVIAVFGIVQALDATMITPRILGEHTGLPPLMVIVALMVGGDLFGFLGVLLAVPTAAILNILLQDLYQRYLQSNFYVRDAKREDLLE